MNMAKAELVAVTVTVARENERRARVGKSAV